MWRILISLLNLQSEAKAVRFANKIIKSFKKGNSIKAATDIAIRYSHKSIGSLIQSGYRKHRAQKRIEQQELLKALKEQRKKAREQARWERRNAKYNARWNMAELNYKLKQQKEKSKQYRRQQKELFKTIVPMDHSSWIMSAIRPNAITIKGRGKIYTIKGLTNALIDKMKRSSSPGKFLWNTVWLHKRVWTKPKSGQKTKFTQETLQAFSAVRNRTVKTGDITKHHNRSVSSVVKTGKLTAHLMNISIK